MVIVDFPDPGTYSIGKLYSSRFYQMLLRHLAPAGVVSVQSTSPLVAPKSYWCIAKTIQSVGLHVSPYRVSVPTFGVWGFVLASREPCGGAEELAEEVRPALRFLTTESMQSLFVLPTDLTPVECDLNRLDNQVLVRYYEQEWRAGGS